MMWTQRAILLYPHNSLSDAQKDTLAQAYVDTVALETFANERLMFDKAAAYSSDYGASETHRAIHSAMTPELATALKAALTGVDGTWYILDADALLDTNDDTKGDHGLDWQAGISVTAGEVMRYSGQFFEVVQGHTTQNDWTPMLALALFKPYLPPGETLGWQQPFGGHDAYPVGARVLFEGEVWVNTISANVWRPGVAGWQRENEPEPTPDWKAGIAYKVGDVVTYQGAEYQCLQAHTSQAGWTPSAVPALWKKL